MIVLALTACAVAGCSTIDLSDGDIRPTAHKGAARYTSSSCFYSDASGVDRVVGSRIVHWCGPEPRALF